MQSQLQERYKNKVKERAQKEESCCTCIKKLPRIVVSDFGIFVCDDCADVFRRLNMRTKDMNHSVFEKSELNTIQGNKAAYKIYFPNNFNIGKGRKDRRKYKTDGEYRMGLRSFIKQIFVEKKYYNTEAEEKVNEENKKREIIRKRSNSINRGIPSEVKGAAINRGRASSIAGTTKPRSRSNSNAKKDLLDFDGIFSSAETQQEKPQQELQQGQEKQQQQKEQAQKLASPPKKRDIKNDILSMIGNSPPLHQMNNNNPYGQPQQPQQPQQQYNYGQQPYYNQQQPQYNYQQQQYNYGQPQQAPPQQQYTYGQQSYGQQHSKPTSFNNPFATNQPQKPQSNQPIQSNYNPFAGQSQTTPPPPPQRNSQKPQQQPRQQQQQRQPQPQQRQPPPPPPSQKNRHQQPPAPQRRQQPQQKTPPVPPQRRQKQQPQTTASMQPTKKASNPFDSQNGNSTFASPETSHQEQISEETSNANAFEANWKNENTISSSQAKDFFEDDDFDLKISAPLKQTFNWRK